MSSSIQRPMPAISLDTLPDPLAVIAAGLGSWLIQSKVQYGDPSRAEIAVMLVEDATGFPRMNADEARMNERTGGMYGQVYRNWCQTAEAVADILCDLPDRIWQRVSDELSAYEPDRALRIIQMHHNIVNQLCTAEPPAREPAADPSVVRLAAAS